MSKKKKTIKMLNGAIHDAKKKYMPNATIGVKFLENAAELLGGEVEPDCECLNQIYERTDEDCFPYGCSFSVYKCIDCGKEYYKYNE